MNKPEIIETIANECGISIKDAGNCYDTVLSIISGELKLGNSITLKDIGTLSVKASPERKGRNPATGELITIAAHNKVAFKAANAVKKLVN